MNWLLVSIYWWAILFVLGLVFFPVTKRFFSNFFDQGYAFSKTISILALTYTMYVVGTLHILSFSRSSLFFLIILSVFLIAFFSSKYKDKNPIPIKVIIFEEIFFLVSFLFLAFTRGQESSIRGLEKFMDFGFMNSILRAKYFPPLDMWLSSNQLNPQGFSINYYYFGHLTGAFLIKLSNVLPSVGYNLILATIFALSIVGSFSLGANLVYFFKKYVLREKNIPLLGPALFGLLASYIVNLGGNLHTIYLFTKGYPNESPIPFWKILSWFNPQTYWYPNATRFIPYTIHEFPSYSYVVADLHGHVFDIPFVLLTLAILFLLIFRLHNKKAATKYLILNSALIGFMVAIHYMTNAFDGPIYLLVSVVAFFVLFRFSFNFLLTSLISLFSFLIFSLPFTYFFKSFVTGIGLNCSPDILLKLQKLGPFIFEQGKCQVSPFWMLFILWGFFIVSFVILAILKFWRSKETLDFKNFVDLYISILFSVGIFFILIPEFIYAKDIYPLHFRANTMFKLGYEAFIMMGIASAFVFFRISLFKDKLKQVLKTVFLFLFFFVFLYPFFSFPSYYGQLNKTPQLDGSLWFIDSYPQDLEIINFLNKNVQGQPVILEAQGDSYTDYERISAYTGLPTVAGWWVHEWLWRGSSDVVGQRIPDIEQIYQSSDLNLTQYLLRKYRVKYVIVSGLEKTKYPSLNESKFTRIGTKVFESSNGIGAIYQVSLL